MAATHRILLFQAQSGKGPSHVAPVSSTRIALMGWLAGAFKLTARDRRIGTSTHQKLRRLHLVT